MNELLTCINRRRFKGHTATKVKVDSINLPELTLYNGNVGYKADFEIESQIHELLQQLNRKSSALNNFHIDQNGLDESQVAAIQNAITNHFSIISGNAGSGKTRTIQGMVSTLIDNGVEAEDIAICSVLGVVANKLKSLTGINCHTINKLLEFKQIDDEYHPQRNEFNQLSCKYLIIDEATLISNTLGLALLKAVPLSVHLVLVGDPGQVLSIQPGAFFVSVAESELYKKVELKSNYRNGGSKIEALALDLISAKMVSDIFDYRATDLAVIQTFNDIETKEKITNAIFKAIRSGLNLNQIQILTPVHKGDVGTESLNQILISSTRTQTLTKELKVILKNNNYHLGVFNGQIGTAQLNSDSIAVNVNGRRMVFKDHDAFENSCELAYALTPHRIQGAEFDLVIVVLPFSCQMINSNWAYSAITRTKKSLVIVGDVTNLNCLEKNSRNTFLQLFC